MSPHPRDIFSAGKIGIGVIHLAPLPGSPDFAGSLQEVQDRALREAELLTKAGFDGLIVENYGDLPFFKDDVGPETVEAMITLTREIKASAEVPVGVNVLRNDFRAALTVAAACECEFIRVNILVGAYVTPEGLIEGKPGLVLRLRRQLAPAAKIFADVRVKHAYPLAATTIDEDALDVAERGKADYLIVTGSRTGSPPTGEDLRAVKIGLEKAALNVPMLVGSGLSPVNAADFLTLTDGFIVGSYIRKHGKAGEEIDLDKAVELVRIKKSVED
jgi:membrane complex biogenesis BtpA family protein